MSASNGERIDLLREMLRKAGDGNNAANIIRSSIPSEKSDVRKSFVETMTSGEAAFDLGAWHGMRLAVRVFEQWAAMTTDPGPSGRFRIVENDAAGLSEGPVLVREFVADGRGTSFVFDKEDGGSCNG